ncbi:MAG: alpha/beta hydrolase [Chitinophagaceae bacterium]|nr:alpha/beta hydrolase [Chitinophagaceae bacterium]
MEKQVIITGRKIFYRVTGNGKPVLLVHGFGETGEVWNDQVDYLKHRFLLIVPDLPGSGKSDIIDDMSMEGMAEIIKAVVDAESLNRVDLIGHSMGGYITLAFAEKYPEMLHSFGLFHSTAYADSEEKKAIRQKGIAFIRQHGAFEFLKTTTSNLFSSQTKDETPELIDEFVQSLNNFLPDSLVLYYQSMIRRPDRTAVLKGSKMPVLFIMGESDNAVPLQDGLQQSHLPERATIHILHHSGHMGMLEETEKSNRLLEEFLMEP